MAISADILRRLAALDLEPAKMAEVLSILADGLSSDKPRSPGAIRQARHRAKKAAAQQAVTGDVTHNVTGDVTGGANKECPQTPIETTSLTNVRENSSAREANFARVREAYPKRSGGDPRKSALKAFDSAMKRGADLEAIVAGARAFAAFRSTDDPKFTPMLATWLNRDGWLDEYSSPPPRAGPAPQRSILSRIAMGTFFDEQPDHATHEQPSTGAAVSSGRGSAGEVPQSSRADRGGPVVDLRPTGSGWR